MVVNGAHLLPVGGFGVGVASSAVVLAIQGRPTSRAAGSLAQIIPINRNFGHFDSCLMQTFVLIGSQT